MGVAGFAGDEFAFAVDAPAVAGQRAVGAHDAVAGDGQGDGIGGASARHGAHGARRADAAGQLGIGNGRARRDVAQRLPYLALERRAAHVQGQVQPHGRIFHEAHHGGHPAFEFRIAADQAGGPETVLQSAHQAVGVFVQGDFADARRGGGHEQRAQRALADRETDVHAFAFLAEDGGRHAQHGGRSLVKAAAGVEAGAVHGVGDAGAAVELLARAARAQGVGIGLGRDAGDRLENAVEMEAAHAGLAGQGGKIGRLLAFQRAAGALDGGGVLFRQGGGLIHAGLLEGRRRAGPAVVAL